MTDTILYTRDMIGRDSKGHVVRATAKLYSLGSQAPYFSFTTGQGAALDLIREAFQDIAHYVDLHLCDINGAPMHCIANAIYFAEQGDKAALVRHLRIDETKAESIVGAVACIPAEVRAQIMQADYEKFLMTARREHESMIRYCRGRDDIAARKERDAMGTMIELSANGGLSHYRETVTRKRREKYMDSIVAGLRDGWQGEARDCIEWLDLEKSEGDYMTDGALQWDDDSPTIRFDGETFNIDDSHDMGDGLHVKWNGADYHLFEDSDIAGKAARDYWEDMAHNDKSEFTCIVGEAALIAWALSESYAVGSVSVDSLEEWLDLWLATPEEHWASYDGETCEVLINESMAEELGIAWDGEGIEWQSAVMYRC